MDEPRQFRRRILYLLIGSILFGAVLGLVIVLRGEWSWFEVRVMITAATIAAASIGALACDMAHAAREQPAAAGRTGLVDRRGGAGTRRRLARSPLGCVLEGDGVRGRRRDCRRAHVRAVDRARWRGGLHGCTSWPAR